MISLPLPTERVMVPSHLPKLTIYQPDWFEEQNAREREADFGFRREMALKKLWSVYDEDEIDEYLQLDDDDPLIGEVLLDLGLYQGVHTESLHHLMEEFGMLETEEEEEGEVYSAAGGDDDDDAQSDEYLDYYREELGVDSVESLSETDSQDECYSEEEAIEEKENRGYYSDANDVVGETS
ncbi:uncharacterized protein PG998_006781 [Apiospora kogelbergensis]|uniref:uncharacterized protein n=1 Tax=Apiospora kogelbergensis TaxID=1337665 RepID=UPI00312CE81A